MRRGHQRGLALLRDSERVVHLGHRLECLDDGVADQVGERHLAAARPLQMVVDHGAVVEQQLDRHGPHAGGRRDGERRLHVGDHAGSGPPQGRGLGLGRIVRRHHDLGQRHRRRGGGQDPLTLRCGRGGQRRLCDGGVGLGCLSGGSGRRRSGGSSGNRRRGRYDRCGGSRGAVGRGGSQRFPGGGVGQSSGVAQGVVAQLLVAGGPVVGEEVPPRWIDGLAVAQVLLVKLIHQPLIGSERGGGGCLGCHAPTFLSSATSLRLLLKGSPKGPQGAGRHANASPTRQVMSRRSVVDAASAPRATV